MSAGEKFIYRQSSDLNSIIFNMVTKEADGFYEFIDGVEYAFVNQWDNTVNIYGTFSHINSFFIEGRYDYYTSISITLEHYRLIKLILLGSGLISIR
jgi:hypothetical protein